MPKEIIGGTVLILGCIPYLNALLQWAGVDISMHDFFKALNDNQGALIVLLTLALVIVTAIYAALTNRLVVETRKMREAQIEPHIAIFVEPRDEWINFMDLTVANLGSGPANKIKFRVEPDFDLEIGGLHLSHVGFIEKGLDYLAPNQKIKMFLTSLAENFEKKLEHKFSVDVKYEDLSGKEFNSTFEIDFSRFKNIQTLGQPPIFEIKEEIKGIRSELRGLAGSTDKILNEWLKK